MSAGHARVQPKMGRPSVAKERTMRLTMRDASAESGQRLGFTSLIDIVFLLLVFFVMTISE
jgi:hypothetical protein